MNAHFLLSGYSSRNSWTTTLKRLVISEQQETDVPIPSHTAVETGNCKTYHCRPGVASHEDPVEAKVYFAHDIDKGTLFDKEGPVKPIFPWDLYNEHAGQHGLRRLLKQVYPRNAIKSQERLPRHTSPTETSPSASHSTSSPGTTTVTSTTSTMAPRPTVPICTTQIREVFSCNYSEKHAFCSKYGVDYCLISERDVLLSSSKTICVYEKSFTPEDDEDLFFKIRCFNRKILFVAHT